MEIIVRYYEKNTRKSQILKALSIINSAQNYYFYKLEEEHTDLCEENQVSWEDFREKQVMEGNQYTIYITEKPFNDNWFSHEETQCAVISTHSWEDIFAPPSLKAYLVYQIAQASINFEGDINDSMEMRMVHDDPKGCMFDLCTYKSDIKLGMISGSICPQCRAVLVTYGISEKAINAVEKMLWHVRAEAIGKPIVYDDNAAFIIMRFTENDENNNAYKYGINSA